MLELNLKIDFKRPYIFAKKELSIEANFTLAEAYSEQKIPIAIFLEKLFSGKSPIPFKCFPQEFSDGKNTIVDYRGNSEPLSSAKEEEILYTDGIIMDCEEEDSSTSTTEIPFFIKITSKFNSFKDSSHITYDVEQQTSPELHEIKNELSGRLISRLFPFRLNQVRLGFEAFSGSSFGGMFGLVPVVTEKFNLEINDNKICLQAKCSFKDKATHLPFNKINLFEKIDLALSEAKLFPNFFEKLSTQLN